MSKQKLTLCVFVTTEKLLTNRCLNSLQLFGQVHSSVFLTRSPVVCRKLMEFKGYVVAILCAPSKSHLKLLGKASTSLTGIKAGWDVAEAKSK